MKDRFVLAGLWGVFLLASSSTRTLAVAMSPVTLENTAWSVAMDPAFPRMLSCRSQSGGGVLAGQPDPFTPVVELNGKAEPCSVSLVRRSAGEAEYLLSFEAQKVEIGLRVSVLPDGVEWRATKITERGTIKVMRWSFPGNGLIRIRASQSGAEVAAVHADGYNNWKEFVGPLGEAPVTDGSSGNYVFLSADGIAAGLASSHMDDTQRVHWKITGMGESRECAAQNPVWQYREIEAETLPLPVVRVLLTGDRNGDARADWQDAALVCRAFFPKPYGFEYVRLLAADQIAMNFASLAQQPFLRILDEVKKAYLITDGLGQSVLLKGFTAEGHDSANTDYGGHYNERAGGLNELRFLLAKMKRYQARGGVHINATEVYPEAQRYLPEILDRDGAGRPKGGWYWLDHSHLIDKRKDLLTGHLFAALDQMRRELPELDFVYVDVYGDHGWNAWKLAGKLNGLKLPIYTEYSTVFDPWSVWAHNRDFRSKIFRFLWNGERDLCESDSLLRGADHVGFMGWQGERNLNIFLRTVFSRNLPTKYLQSFPLLKWTPEKEALFGGGLKVTREGDQVTASRNEHVRMMWKGNGTANRLFIPWDPVKEQKIYVWDDVGSEYTWDLPESWKGRTEVFLYTLTDLGKTGEQRLPVREGKVTLKVKPSTPYVIYPAPAPATPAMDWGEGSLVKDPGFDSHGFASWKVTPAEAASFVRSENTTMGNTRLVIAGGPGAVGGVSQCVTGLKGGQTYAASVWVQVTGERKASIEILPLEGNGAPAMNYVARTSAQNRNDSDSKLGTNFQRLRVIFTLPPACTGVTLSLHAAASDGTSAVEFDDVRLVPTRIAPEAQRHYFYEDFENVDQGWGPFVYDSPGQTQTHLSETHAGVTEDTLGGRYSFKTRDEPAGRVVRTLPSMLRLKPRTTYRVTIDTLADNDGVYQLAAFHDDREAQPVWREPIAKGRHALTHTWTTGAGEEGFLSIEKTEKNGGKLVLDHLRIDIVQPGI